MSINNYLIKFFSKYVGQDEHGNQYYKSEDRRFVVYNGIVEPSKVPPMWHAWLHHMIDTVPSHNELEKYKWQVSHAPNLTGTKQAYAPVRKIISSDYQPWNPS